MSGNIFGNTAIQGNINGPGITLENTIKEFSIDGTMGDNSDLALPTEKAVTTYVTSSVSSADEWIRTGTLITPKTSGDTLGVDTVQTESGTGDLTISTNTKLGGAKILKVDQIQESTALGGTTFNTKMRLGATQFVDQILDEDDMVSDSDSSLATQQSIKAYGDNLITTHESTYTHSDIALNTTHRTSNGTDHTYINQDVTTTAGPTFGSVTTNDINYSGEINITESSGSSQIQFYSDVNLQGGFNSSGLYLATGSTVNSIKDEDDMTSDSNTSLVTQQSAKAYVDNVKVNALNAGVIDGFAITDNLDGTVDIASGNVWIRNADSNTAPIEKYSVTGVSAQAIGLNETRYFYVDYNSGTPIITSTTTESPILENENSQFEIYEVVRNGTTNLHITNHCQCGGNIGRAIQKFLYERYNAVRTSGLIISETGTRNLQVSAGRIWVKVTENDTAAIDTSVSDTFSAFYDDGASSHTEVTAQTQWDNTQYDDGSGTLATLTNNRYGFHDLWMETDGDLVLVYGNVDSVTQAAAENADVISDLPIRLGDHAVYIGRIVFQKSAGTLSSILTAFDSTLQAAVVTDHGNLGGLTDDDHTQYFNSTRLGDGTLTALQVGATTQITGILDEDNMVSDSNTSLATQQSIKAYSDGLITTHEGTYTHTDIALNTTHRSSDGKDHSDVVLNNTHRSSNGTDHTYINQDVATTASPSFTGVTLSGLATDVILQTNGTSSVISSGYTPAQLALAITHVTSNGTDHTYINQDVTTTASPSFTGVTLSGLATDVILQTNGSSSVISSGYTPAQLALAITHVTSSGSDHTYINQDVTTTGTPTFGTITLNPADTSSGIEIQGDSAGNTNLVLNKDGATDLSKIDLQTAGVSKYYIQHDASDEFKIYDEIDDRNLLNTSGDFLNTDAPLVINPSVNQLCLEVKSNLNGNATMSLDKDASNDTSQIAFRIAGVNKWYMRHVEISTVPNWQFVGPAGTIMQIDDTNGEMLLPKVYDDTVTSSRDLEIQSDGKIGYVSSIRASKMNISDITNTDYLHQLQPVQFNYRKIKKTVSNNPDYTPNGEEPEFITTEEYLNEVDSNEIQYGLIAEDVEQVNSDLVFYDNENNLKGVHYKKLIPPMLKEIQNLKNEHSMGEWTIHSDDTSGNLKFEDTTAPETCIAMELTKDTGIIKMPMTYNSVITDGRDLEIQSDGTIGYAPSLRNTKMNIRKINNVSWLNSLNPVYFNYKQKGHLNKPCKELQFGLIAEEVVKVQPEITFKDNEGKLCGVNYKKLIVPMLKMLQRQQQEISILKSRINLIENK